MPLELLHITAAYSNAVLVAIMPQVSEFADTLELEIERPVRLEQVRYFHPDKRAGFIGGWVGLTNGYRFSYSHGYVLGFDAPDSFFTEQNADKVPNYFGAAILTQEEALDRARGYLKKLDYAKAYPDLVNFPTRVRGPKKLGTNTIPYADYSWMRTGDVGLEDVIIEIDLKTGACKRLSTVNRKLRKTPPVISVKPELLKDYRARMKELEKSPEQNSNAPPRLPERKRRTVGEDR